MSYSVHNFQTGDTIDASDFNEIDTQLYNNTVFEKTEYCSIIQGQYHSGYHVNSTNTGYTDEIQNDRTRTFKFDSSKYKILVCKFLDTTYKGNTEWKGTSPLIVNVDSTFNKYRVEIRLKTEADFDFSSKEDIVSQTYLTDSMDILVYHDESIDSNNKKLSEITQITYKSLDAIATYTPNAFITLNGTIRENTRYVLSDYVEVTEGDSFKGDCWGSAGYSACVTFYDSDKVMKSDYTITPSGTQYSDAQCLFDFVVPNGIKYLRFCYITERPRNLNAVINDYERVLTKNVKTIIANESIGVSPKFAHLSFDDVIFCMQDITNNAESYTSVFDNSFFKMLKELHETYGTVVSLYLFISDSDSWTDKFKDEFAYNSNWLKFGLHENGHNYESTSAETALADYNKFTNLIMRITGSTDCIDKCPRLGSFKGNLDSVLAMRDANCGIVGLLSAYDDRTSYYLGTSDNAYLYKHGKLEDTTNHITFFRSVKAFEATSPTTTLPALYTLSGCNGNSYLIEMMHEYGVYDSSYELITSMVERLEYGSEFANQRGYTWDFPMYRAMI